MPLGMNYLEICRALSSDDLRSPETIELRIAFLLAAVSADLGSGGCEGDATAAARAVLGRLGGPDALAVASASQLEAAGLSPYAAHRVWLALDLARTLDAFERQRVDTPAHVVLLARRMGWSTAEQETFVVASLDTRQGLVGADVIAVGSVNGVEVHPREVFRAAIRRGASGVVLLHNHPSGDPTPSDDDIDLTRRLVAAGHALGIPVVDHVVVTRTSDHVSLAQRRPALFELEVET